MPEKKPRIALVGASGQGSVVADIVEKQQAYEIAGFLDQSKPLGYKVLGYPVLGVEADLPRIRETHAISGIIVTIGDNWVRCQAVRKLQQAWAGVDFVQAIHPSAQIARGVEIGAGTVIMAGAVTNSNARIGKHCILNTNSSLDHDSVMGDFSSLAPGVTTGGAVFIGEYTVIAQGATIIHSRRVGDHAVIGPGAVVVKDIPGYVVAHGVPARIVRSRQAGEKYL